MHLKQQRRLGCDIKFAADYLGYSSDFPALLRLTRLDEPRLLLELRVRAVRVVDELLVQSQRFVVHESLAATIALDRSVQLQANILEGSITAHRQRGNFRHEGGVVS